MFCLHYCRGTRLFARGPGDTSGGLEGQHEVQGDCGRLDRYGALPGYRGLGSGLAAQQQARAAGNGGPTAVRAPAGLALAFYANTAVVLAGANVYTIDDVNGTNDPISASLLGNLISRVQALYKHH